MNFFKSQKFITNLGNLLLVIISYTLAKLIVGEYPLWAPMTTLIVIQPTRGKSFHLGLSRLFGTILGAFISIVLMFFFHGNITVVVFTLTLVIAISAGLSCLGGKNSGYIFQLAGYTAAIVFLLSYGANNDVRMVSLLRISESFIGIGVALLGLFIIKKESESKKLGEALEATKNIAYEWVRLSLKDGVNEENVSLRKSLLKKINELSELSMYASSESFYMGIAKRKTIYYMGTLYTILSINRRILRKLAIENPSNRKDFTEVDFPELNELFKKLDYPIEKIKLRSPINLKAAMIAFTRVAIGGFVSGAIWLYSGWKPASTFFLVTLIHSSLLTTIHQPVDRIKRIVTSVLISFFVVYASFQVFPPDVTPTFLHFLFLVIPGFILECIPKMEDRAAGVNLFSIVLYSMVSAHHTDFHVNYIFQEYATFIGGLLFALILTRLFMPQLSTHRYLSSREKLQKEFKHLTALKRPLENDWMMVMYSYVEDMLFYSKEIQMDENDVMNESLSMIDVGVELLELRSRMALLSEDHRENITVVIAEIRKFSVDLEKRLMKLKKLSDDFLIIDPSISYTLNVIISKLEKNKKIFMD